MGDTFRIVEEHLRKISSPRHRGKPITPETELYRDLGIYGDDMAFDVVLWASREFGVEGRFHLPDYAPGEKPFLPLWKLWVKLRGKKELQYQSLTVRDVVAAIEAKRWPD